ncbi:MAG: outer membrane protein assembly factor, partial [Muribaculum sp.]|nr:outer membrane protein assembly factor [Muribaculum sp.]
LVDNVDIKIVDNSEVQESELVNYLRQTPNHKVLGFMKLQLATYNISGSDTTKWFNRWVRRLGQPPVIYDQQLTEMSEFQLRQALVNRGYMSASVTADTVIHGKGKKVDITYNITTGKPHFITTLDYNIPDDSIRALIKATDNILQVAPGDILDRNRLDEERARITELLRNHGYYTFNKEYITFSADTAAGSREVNLTMNLRPPHLRGQQSSSPDSLTHRVYYIRNIFYVTDYNPGVDYGTYEFHSSDTVHYKDITILYGDDRYLRPKVLFDACHIQGGKKYHAWQIDRTYESLGRLGILKYVNIDMRRVGTIDGKTWLDAYILLTRGKKQGVSLELEGTNSEGDLGFGVGLTYM